MKVQVKDVGEFEVKNISYSEARQLHRENAKTFWNMNEGDNVDPDKYYELIEKVKELSGIKDGVLKEYNMIQVDQILQSVLLHYTGLDPKGSGD